MAVYFIGNSTITDPEMFKRYQEAVRATFEGHQMRSLVSTFDAQTIEGDSCGSRAVVIEFPDEAAFRAWYDSPAYQAVLNLRLDSSEGFALLAQGR